jgi:Fe-S cluster biogenesis protein NfuA
MKMGIERALKAAFGDQLVAVEQVEAVDTAATLIAVDGHLDMLRPAIKNYGGTVKVCHYTLRPSKHQDWRFVSACPCACSAFSPPKNRGREAGKLDDLRVLC